MGKICPLHCQMQWPLNRVVKLNAVDSRDQTTKRDRAARRWFRARLCGPLREDGQGIFGGIYDAGLNIIESCGINTFTGTWETPSAGSRTQRAIPCDLATGQRQYQGQLFQRTARKLATNSTSGAETLTSPPTARQLWVALSSNGAAPSASTATAESLCSKSCS